MEASADRMTAGRLESERLTLEPLRPEHADELSPVLDDVALHQFIGGRPDSAEELRARFERQAAGHSPDGRECWLNWTIRLRRTGQAVGTMQATVSRHERGTIAEVAWVVGVAHQGRGVAKEAAALVVLWLRGRGVARIRAHIHPAHRTSMGVARSVGLLPTDIKKDGEVRWEWTSDGASSPAASRSASSRRRPRA